MKISHLVLLAALGLPGCASNKASVKEKTGDVYHQAGVEALMARRYSEALGNLIEASKNLPKDAAVWTNLGLAYANKGDFAKAEESWKRALTLNAKWTDARLNLGALMMRQKRLKEAEAMLKEAAKDLAYLNQHQVYYNLALLYQQINRPLVAEQQLKLAVDHSPDFCEAWYRLGNLQKERGAINEATHSLSKSVGGTCFRLYPEAHFEIASLYLKRKDNARGKAKLIEVIQLFPDTDLARKAEFTLNMIR